MSEQLVGSVSLFSGGEPVMSLYDVAFLQYPLLEGASQLAGGAGQLVSSLLSRLETLGGVVECRREAVGLRVESAGRVWVYLRDGDRFSARRVVSAVHPWRTVALLRAGEGQAVRGGDLGSDGGGEEVLSRKSERRIGRLHNSIGFGCLWLSVDREACPFSVTGHNLTLYRSGGLWWNCYEYGSSFDLSAQPVMVSWQSPLEGADRVVAVVMMPVPWRYLSPFVGSQPGDRPREYQDLKEALAEALYEVFREHYPLQAQLSHPLAVATPLTYHRYTGVCEGSAYGLMRTVRSAPLRRILEADGIPNVHFANQLSVNGILGNLISSFYTRNDILRQDGGCR